MKATVHVTLKPSILDPQGEAVRRAIQGIGLESIQSARIGKFIELEIAGGKDEKTEEKLHEICRDLLSNPIIENYTLSL